MTYINDEGFKLLLTRETFPRLRHYKFIIKVLYVSMFPYAEWLYDLLCLFLSCICPLLAQKCYIDIAVLQIS